MLFVGAVLCSFQGATLRDGHCSDGSIEERLSRKDQSSFIKRFWRQKRAYPHADLAQRLLLQNRPEQAKEVYDTYLATDPEHLPMAWFRLQVIVQTGTAQEVIAACDDLLQRVTDVGPIYAIRGRAYLETTNRAGAADDFAKALADPELASDERQTLTRSLTLLRLQQGETKEAERLGQTLVTLWPEVAEHHLLYAEVLSLLGSARATQHQWRLAMDMTSDPAMRRQLTLTRGAALLATNEVITGRQVLLSQETTRLFEGAPLLQRFELHLLRIRCGNEQQVQRSLRQAKTELKNYRQKTSIPDLAVLWTRLGDAAFARTQFVWASEAYTEAWTLDSNPQIQVKAARAAWQAGRYERVVFLLQNIPRNHLEAERQQSVDLLLCEAYEKLGQTTAALDCLDQATYRYPQIPTLAAKAAQLAHTAGLIEQEILFLQRYYQLKPGANLALDIGYLYRAKGKTALALPWFEQAWQLEPSPQAGLTLVHSLFALKRYPEVVHAVARMQPELSDAPREKAQVLLLDAQSRMELQDYAGAAAAWAEADHLAPSPQAVCGRMEALRRLGRLEEAVALSLDQTKATLPEWLGYLDLRGALLLALEREEEALDVFEKAAVLEPNSERLLQISMLAQKKGDWVKAEDSARQAGQLDPANISAKKQLAFLLAAHERYDEATSLFLEVQEKAPADVMVSSALGYSLVQLGRNREAVAAYARMVSATDTTALSPATEAERLQAIKGIQNQVAELDRGLSYTLGLGTLFNQDESRQYGWDQDKNATSGAYGIAELAYRPEDFGYLGGKSTDLYGRLIWNEDGSVTNQDDSPYQGSLGARIKPFASANVVLTTEALFSLTDSAANDLLVRLAHSYSHTAWQDFHRDAVPKEGLRYCTSYAEVGTSLTGTVDVLYTAQGRYGYSLPLKPDWFLSPFVYGAVSGYGKEEGSALVVEGGGGIALNFFAAYDQLHGARREGELVLRLGRANSNEDGVSDASFRAFIGFRITGF